MMSELLRALITRLDAGQAKVAIVGQGQVGLPVAMRAREIGFSVVGYETSRERLAALRAGNSYVGDVPDGQLRDALAAGFLPTDDPADLAGFDVAVVTVPTPLRDGAPDLSFIEEAVRSVPASAARNARR